MPRSAFSLALLALALGGQASTEVAWSPEAPPPEVLQSCGNSSSCIPSWLAEVDPEACWATLAPGVVAYNADRPECGPPAQRPPESPAASALSLASPVEAGDVLRSRYGAVQACRRVGVDAELTCTPIELACHLPEVPVGQVPTAEYAARYLEAWACRYGGEHRLGVSRGDHSKLAGYVRKLLDAPSNPLGITRRHATVQEEEIDANLLSDRGRRQAVVRALEQFADLTGYVPDGPGRPCSGGWICEPMPAAVARECLDGSIRCVGFAFDGNLCWLRQTSRITYNSARPDCVPANVVAPPPPPDPCGDGLCAGGETCTTCRDDCGPCPPTPPEDDGCAALHRAVEAVCPTTTSFRPALPSTGRLDAVLVEVGR